MNTTTSYLDAIRAAFPDLALHQVEVNEDGMVNVAVIVNRERVFRFPRAEWGVPLLRQEARALDLVRPIVDIPVPRWDIVTDEMVSYPYIAGAPLLTDDVMRMSEREKDATAERIGRFLRQLHTIPLEAVTAAGIGRSDTVRAAADWLELYAAAEAHLFPLMWADGREWVRRHFAPLLADPAFMDHEPVFMHGDLASYHLLHDPATRRFTGIIDFGTAGVGDPAADFATMINQYGESFLRRMRPAYPEIGDHIQRARFWAGTLELQWILRGLRRDDPSMLVVHLGRARDVHPIDAPW